MKQQISEDQSAIKDRLSLGSSPFKTEGKDLGIDTKSTVKSQEKNSEVSGPEKKKKKSDDFQSELQRRIQAKKERTAEFNKKMDDLGPILKPGLPTGDSGWILAGDHSGASFPDKSGSTKNGTFSMGNPMAGTLGSPMSGTVDSGAFGSQNMLGGTSPDIDATAQLEFEQKAEEQAQNVAEQQQREMEFQQAEAEWEAKEQQAELEEQATKEAETLAQQMSQTQEQTQTMASPGGSEAANQAQTTYQEETTFQPDSTTTEEVTAEQLEATAQEAINEAVGEGREANQEMLKEAAIKHLEVKAKTQQARESAALEAPKFSQDLSRLMEEYAHSDSQSEQSIVKAQIESLLDGVGDGLQEQAKTIRDQVSGMFAQSEATWAKRESAKDLKVLSSSETRRANTARTVVGTNVSDADFLKNQTRKSVQQAPQSSKVNSDRVAQVLKSKGVVN